jgi:hypothetical protein
MEEKKRGTKPRTQVKPGKPTKSGDYASGMEEKKPKPKATPKPKVAPKAAAKPTPRVNPTGSLVEGEAQMTARRAATQAAGRAAGKAAGGLGIRALGGMVARAAGAAGLAYMVGDALKDTGPALKARSWVSDKLAKGDNEPNLSSNTFYGRSRKEDAKQVSEWRPEGRKRSVMNPSDPSTPSARTAYHKPSNSSGSKSKSPASKSQGRTMMGAELADFLGLSQSSAVRSNLVNNAKKKK